MWTVLAEAKYDGQSQQEAKIGGLVCTLCSYCLVCFCTMSEVLSTI